MPPKVCGIHDVRGMRGMAYVIIGALGGASKCVPKGRGGPTSFHSLRGDAKCVPK